MTEPLRLAIVGCGGMGRRHLAGLGELRRGGRRDVELVAVCDPRLDNAEFLAAEAEQLLRARPEVFGDAETMVARVSGLEAADCTTDTRSHHEVAPQLFDLGLHVLCEKPLALTIRGCHRVIEAADRRGRVLSVAENFRRDPMNRLVRALIDGGAIGDPQFILEAGVAGGDAITITPWRHLKMGGVLPLDAGVHSADILQYYFGPVERASGQIRIFEPRRHRRQTAGPGGFYERWAQDMPEVMDADGEDAIFGLLEFASGALGQWIDHHAGHGLPFHARKVFGTRGSIEAPGDRNGRPPRLILDDGTDVGDERLLEFAPGYQLDEVAASLFGADRPWRYGFDFETTDRKLIGLEYQEFAACVREGVAPEVDGATALRDVALVYALFESARAGRQVTVAEVREGGLDGYQREIDMQLGLAAR
ncbi:MAG TPA: Gfo/Idh/MocA family oxidoreductase [Candidatus Dormibacteraeota bacterium]|jgi:predicted dehydrogenase|nr:Gfo/Idh/MocA family oxidoreductase [Candidatus Dormibacteraeota bacterium]